MRANNVTFDPRPCHAVAISTPIPPPPTTTNRGGTALLSVAFRLVHGFASATPGMSGSVAVLPVQMAMALRAANTTDSVVGGCDRNTLRTVQARVTTEQFDVQAFDVRGLACVVPVGHVAVASAEHPSGLDGPAHRFTGAVDAKHIVNGDHGA